jgi:hypothetical protein
MNIQRVSVYNNQRNNQNNQIQKQKSSQPAFGATWEYMNNGKKCLTSFGKLLKDIVENESNVKDDSGKLLTQDIVKKLKAINDCKNGFIVDICKSKDRPWEESYSLDICKEFNSPSMDKVCIGQWNLNSSDKYYMKNYKNMQEGMIDKVINKAKSYEEIEELFDDRDAQIAAKKTAEMAAKEAESNLKRELGL